MKPAAIPARPARTSAELHCQWLNSTEQNSEVATQTSVGTLRTSGATRAMKVAAMEKSRPRSSRPGMLRPSRMPARVNRFQAIEGQADAEGVPAVEVAPVVLAGEGEELVGEQEAQADPPASRQR